MTDVCSADFRRTAGMSVQRSNSSILTLIKLVGKVVNRQAGYLDKNGIEIMSWRKYVSIDAGIVALEKYILNPPPSIAARNSVGNKRELLKTLKDMK